MESMARSEQHFFFICNSDIEIQKIQKHTKREREQKKVNRN